MKRIAAVTGATGFVGWHLCAYLERSGWEVRGVVREESRKPLPDGVTRIPANLERASLGKAFGSAEVVFHLAGVTRARNLDAYLPVNVEAARQVGLATRDAAARLVHVSSQAAAGCGTVEHPRLESDLPHPVSDYGQSKLLGEEAIRGIEGLEWIIARPSAVYGPRDRDFQALARLVGRGLFPRTCPRDTAYSMIFVEDLTRLLETLARSPQALRRVFFVCHPTPVTSDDLLQALAGMFGRSCRSIPIPKILLWLVMSLGRPAFFFGRPPLLTESRYRELTAGSFVCSSDRLRRLTGPIEMTSLSRGLKQSHAWYST